MYRKFHTGQEVNSVDHGAVLEQRLKAANEGRNFWNRLAEELPLGDDDVAIVLFGRDKECAEIVLNYGKYLKKFRGSKNIYVITDSGELQKRAQKEEWITKSIECFNEEINHLELLYQLYKFSRQIIWGTLRNIEDADGTCLAGVNEVSLEDIIVTAVLDLPFDKCRE